MSIVNVGNMAVSQASYNRARQLVNKRDTNTPKRASDVLAALQNMMPGWNISTSSSNWGEGFRNIEIDTATLTRMANDPEAMVRYKALILDLEPLVPELEAWAEQHPDMSLDFGLQMALDGSLRAVATVRTLLGGETSARFDLTGDAPSWQSLIMQKLDALAQGETTNAQGGRSWQV